MVRPMEDENSAMCSQFEEPGSLNALLPQLEQALESAMSASGGSGGASFSPGKSAAGAGASRAGRTWGRNRQQVLARLEVVRGVPFYGYHGEEKLFVKVGMDLAFSCTMPGVFSRTFVHAAVCSRCFCQRADDILIYAAWQDLTGQCKVEGSTT